MAHELHSQHTTTFPELLKQAGASLVVLDFPDSK